MTPAIGAAVDRVDGPAKTTGRARYSAEFRYDAIAHAALVYATITRGQITAVDTNAASAEPGVLAVLTHLNAPAMKPPPRESPLNLDTLASGTSVNYLNTDQMH